MSEQHAERKLAAILSADVVGYSRLMADDEAATIRTLRDYREALSLLVRQHRGRVVDAPGDNVLAEFPTALDAVRCALEIQGVLRARNAYVPTPRRMEFRIGVHMGDVAVDADRIYGEGVNIAARLEGLAEAGGICISATVHEQVRNKLEVGYTDLGDQTVKNIPEQVHVYRVQPRGEAPAVAAPAPAARSRSRLPVALAAALLVLVAAGFWVVRSGPGLVMDLAGLGEPADELPLPDKPSVVVLPFTNMSGDPEQEYFADGMTEELTARLSGNNMLFVIARNSAFSYKGKPIMIEDVGRELGVRYVVEGSVRKAGQRIRITAQLIDATDGVHIWSQQYDRELDDVFAVQSEISEGILGAVGVEVREAELARIRRRPTEDLNAYETYMQGFAKFSAFTRAGHAEARRLFGRAIELDPGFVDPYTLLAATYTAAYAFGWSFDAANLDRARELAQQALELDPAFAGAQLNLAAVAISAGRPEQVIAHARQGIALSPGVAGGYAFLAVGLAQDGQPVAALQSLRTARRLDPRSGASAVFTGIRAGFYRQVGRTQEAVELWERARQDNADFIIPRLELASHYVETGEMTEARVLVAEALAVVPELTVEKARTLALRISPRDEKQAAAFAENLRKAGLS